MPFPLAHPAAVLPFRRFCPKLLSFPALVVGSLSPDFAYFFRKIEADEFSHSFLGSFGFCLPTGLLVFGLLYGLHRLAAARLPVPYQQALPSLSVWSTSSAPAVVLSLLIGIWTHLLLDAATHKDGWIVMHLPVLQSTITTVQGRRVRLCHLFWYGGSFVGMMCVFLAFQTWQESRGLAVIARSWRRRALEAALAALLLVPIELAHHLVTGRFGLFLVSTLSLAWILGVVVFLVASQGRNKTSPQETHLNGVGANLPPP